MGEPRQIPHAEFHMIYVDVILSGRQGIAPTLQLWATPGDSLPKSTGGDKGRRRTGDTSGEHPSARWSVNLVSDYTWWSCVPCIWCDENLRVWKEGGYGKLSSWVGASVSQSLKYLWAIISERKEGKISGLYTPDIFWISKLWKEESEENKEKGSEKQTLSGRAR